MQQQLLMLLLLPLLPADLNAAEVIVMVCGWIIAKLGVNSRPTMLVGSHEHH